MSVIFLLIIFSLLLAVGFLFAFFWSVRTGQFDDDYTPSVRMLFDNPSASVDSTENEQETTIPKTVNYKP